MKTKRYVLGALVAGVLALPIHAAADEAAALTVEILALDANASSHGTSNVTNKIAADFQRFAGSPGNANELVNGLRDGSRITLTQRGYPPATFTPPTRPMGFGNVSTSLALAQHQLALQGITQPTPQQLQVALNGGTIAANGRVVNYTGVLQMRADGLGWGEIAQQSGTKLGHLVSGLKSQNAYVATTPGVKPHASTAPVTGTAVNAPLKTPGASGEKGNGGKGIVSASGGASQSVEKGKSGREMSTAGGSSGQGRGVTSASNQSGNSGAQAASSAQGVVTASNAGGAGGGGNGNGQGKALGHTK